MCGRSYLIRYGQGMKSQYGSAALVKGSAVHEFMPVYDDLEDKSKWGAELDALVINELRDSPPVEFTEKDWDDVMEIGEAWVTWQDKNKVGGYTEVKWRAELADGDRVYKLEGIIDRLVPVDGGWELWEFKTGQMHDRGSTLRNFQLMMYAWAMLHGEVCIEGEWKRLSALPVRIVLVFIRQLIPYKTSRKGQWKKGDTRPNAIFTVYPTQFFAEQVESEVILSIRRIEHGIFDMGFGCSTCRVRNHCDPPLEFNENIEAQIVDEQIDAYFEQSEKEAMNEVE